MAESVKQLREDNFKLQKEIVRLEVSLEKSTERMEDLEKRCSDQHEQVMRLQDALVAREAPDAYADRKEDEALPEPSDDEIAAAHRDKELARANRQLLDNMTDDHYFSSADDMIETLMKGATPSFERTHSNDES